MEIPFYNCILNNKEIKRFPSDPIIFNRQTAMSYMASFPHSVKILIENNKDIFTEKEIEFIYELLNSSNLIDDTNRIIVFEIINNK